MTPINWLSRVSQELQIDICSIVIVDIVFLDDGAPSPIQIAADSAWNVMHALAFASYVE